MIKNDTPQATGVLRPHTGERKPHHQARADRRGLARGQGHGLRGYASQQPAGAKVEEASLARFQPDGNTSQRAPSQSALQVLQPGHHLHRPGHRGQLPQPVRAFS